MTGAYDHLVTALADRYRIEREVGRGEWSELAGQRRRRHRAITRLVPAG
ncbi:MAG TPA: hypothetical protein VHR41_01185 [Gemmatimonadales bacterium]|nr:hypothetical protein [Gemmatimonadales bacterium]